MRAAGLALAAILLSDRAGAAVRSVVLEPPARDFGYFLGDVLTAEAIVTVDTGTVLDRGSLPQPGPASRLIDIRHVDVTEAPSGAGRAYRIRVEYQSFYGPDTATAIDVPGYALDFTDKAGRLAAQVPGWRFTASPLRHDVVAVTDARRLRPDHAAPAPQDGAARLRLFGGAGVALLAALALLSQGGVLPAVRMRPRPFGTAARRIPRLLRSPDGQARALLELHRAFDAAAGRSVLAGDIDNFIAQHGAVAGMRPDIERFFAASRRRFFGDGSGDPAVTDAWLRQFARQLGRAERG